MFNIKSKKFFSLLLLGAMVSSFMFLFWPRPAEAILGFGGKILSFIPCLNAGALFFIGPPRGGLFMRVPSTLVFAYGQLRPGPWALGSYFPGGACVISIIPPIVIPALGTMIMIGTSP